MRTIRAPYGLIIFLYTLHASFTKPVADDKSFSEDSDAVDTVEKSYQNPFAEYYRPHQKLDSPQRLENRPLGDFEIKRSLLDSSEIAEEADPVQKRQVGVVYKDDKPIGILQPFQRSYRFIPVKEDNPYISDQEFSPEEVMQPLANTLEIEKRDVQRNLVEDSYPSILTSFKIDNKLDQKRADSESYADDQVKDLKNTIRRLRASNPEKIEYELKNILDDMGLIEEDEVRPNNKREATEEELNQDSPLVAEDEKKEKEDRKKREQKSDAKSNVEKSNGKESRSFYNKPEQFDDVTEEPKAESRRRKRQKDQDFELAENIKDSSNDLTIGGNKVPLLTASNSDSDMVERDIGQQEESEDYDKKVERQIQSKIDNLKEEVKREIAKMKQIQEDDRQRKKRQVAESLVDEETDAVNPIKDSEVELKPLIRKRRNLDEPATFNNLTTLEPHLRKKRDAEEYEPRKKRSNRAYNVQQQEELNKLLHEAEEGAELLSDEFDEARPVSKRNVAEEDAEYEEDSNVNKRSSSYEEPEYFYDETKVNKRQIDDEEEFQEDFPQQRNNRYQRGKALSARFRRALSDNIGNRPQQLSDLSDTDLFGALPKSYSGELTRYKRVKK